jgi:AI-2E family transporter
VLIVQQVEGHVLQPVLVGRALELQAPLVILAVTTGGALAGIIGAFLAVPLVAVAVTMMRYAREQFLARTQPTGGGAGVGPGPGARATDARTSRTATLPATAGPQVGPVA